MLNLTIGGKDYHIEYTIEASLYNECTEKVTGLMASLGNASNTNEIKEMLSSIADIPQTVLTMFYAGLLEHHGEEGDRTILSKKDAKNLIRQYLLEHKDDDTGNFYGVMELLVEQMGNDGFFELIGLNRLMTQTAEEEKKTRKIPQDHKKKVTGK